MSKCYQCGKAEMVEQGDDRVSTGESAIYGSSDWSSGEAVPFVFGGIDYGAGS